MEIKELIGLNKFKLIHYLKKNKIAYKRKKKTIKYQDKFLDETYNVSYNCYRIKLSKNNTSEIIELRDKLNKLFGKPILDNTNHIIEEAYIKYAYDNYDITVSVISSKISIVIEKTKIEKKNNTKASIITLILFPFIASGLSSLGIIDKNFDGNYFFFISFGFFITIGIYIFFGLIMLMVYLYVKPKRLTKGQLIELKNKYEGKRLFKINVYNHLVTNHGVKSKKMPGVLFIENNNVYLCCYNKKKIEAKVISVFSLNEILWADITERKINDEIKKIVILDDKEEIKKIIINEYYKNDFDDFYNNIKNLIVSYNPYHLFDEDSNALNDEIIALSNSLYLRTEISVVELKVIIYAVFRNYNYSYFDELFNDKLLDLMGENENV